jgi:hypothetical protein
MVGEPVAFEPIVQGVPSETIRRPILTEEPVRVATRFIGRKTGGGNFSMFTIPDGKVFEVIDMTVSIVNEVSPPTQNDFIIREGNLSTANNELLHIVLDHQEHITMTKQFSPKSFFINSNTIIAGRIEQVAAATVMEWHFSGFLIKKDEITSKLNIFI